MVEGKGSVREARNAFAGQASQPTEADLEASLGGAKPVLDNLIAILAAEHGVTVTEWRCYSVETGWSLRLKRSKRTIVWLSPCAGCFQVVFILGAKALQAAGRKALDHGVKYPEGTCIRLLVKNARDLGVVKELAVAKIGN